tara:strand:+ start:139 stop:672 length:534 start_codon:yes stop_codon:yes gene_type:complete
LVKDEDEGRPRTGHNPDSLYSLKEIEQEYDEEYDFRQTYGATYPTNYLGNFKPLGDLRADYNMPHIYGDRVYFNYGITKIEFKVVLSSYYSGSSMLDIFVIIHSYGRTKSISWDSDDEIKVLSDFVEIYNQPNHKYKNLTATITLQGRFKNKSLKHVIDIMTSLTDRERYLLTRLKV